MAAKIMVLPGAATHALLAEQPLCDFTITMSCQPGIEGSNHQNEAPATLGRERKRRRAKTAAVKGAPKSMRCLQTEVRIGIERQFDRNRCPLGGYRLQVKPMSHACQRYNAMPAVWRMAKFAVGKHGPIKGKWPRIDGRTVLTERQNGREGFRCPEYRLPVERLFRIGREKRAPIFFGIAEVPRLIAPPMSNFETLARIRYRGGGIPRQRHLSLPFRRLRNLARISNQQPT